MAEHPKEVIIVGKVTQNEMKEELLQQLAEKVDKNTSYILHQGQSYCDCPFFI